MFYLSNICFMCLKELKNLQTVDLNEVENCTVQQIKYVLPEIMLEPEIFVYVCSTCHTELNSFYTFKKLCLDNYGRFKNYSKLLQGSNDVEEQANNIKQVQEETQVINDLTSEIPEETNHIYIKEEFEDSRDQNLYQQFLDIKKENATEQDFFSKVNTDGEMINIDQENQNDSTCNNNLFHELKSSDDMSTAADYIGSTSNINFESTRIIQNMNEESDMKGFECEICNKKFKLRNNLEQHMKMHNGIKDFECPICYKKFMHKKNRERHMKIHNGVKEFECTVCNRKFMLKSSMERHLKKHSNIKDFECSICNKKFTENFELNLHMKKHAGIRDFECPKCKKTFYQNTDLNRHMRLHVGIKEFQCIICNKLFTQGCYMRRHMRKVHKDIPNLNV